MCYNAYHRDVHNGPLPQGILRPSLLSGPQLRKGPEACSSSFLTEIEGSRRMWESHPAEMGAVLARHDAILQEQIEASGDRITKHTDDGATAVFEVGEPVACALVTQLPFAAGDRGQVGRRRIRVGLRP